MIELLTEEDFVELPEQAAHKWVNLEKIAKARLDQALALAQDSVGEQLMLHYMGLIKRLADEFKVSGIAISQESSTRRSYDKFLLSVATVKAGIWATSSAEFPIGRVHLSSETRSRILDLTGEIERQIDSLKLPTHRQAALHKCLEDFRREINQPRTRVGAALASLSQVAGVVALSVTTLAQAPDAYTTVVRMLGLEQINQSVPSFALLEEEKQILLAPPPKQIEDHSGKE